MTYRPASGRPALGRRALSAALCAVALALATGAAAEGAAMAVTLPPAPPVASAASVTIAAERSLVSHPASYLPIDARYAQVYRPSSVYASLDDARAGRASLQRGGQHTWVSVRGQAEISGRLFYRVAWNWGDHGWMAASDLHFNQKLSGLRGVDLRERAGERLAMVYVDALNVRAVPGDLSESSRVGRLRRYDLVSVRETRVVGGALWYAIAEDQWIHSAFVRGFTPRPRPSGVGADEKWIDVNLSEQVVLAMEGDTPVYAALAATGRDGHETVTGLYRIWTKIRNAPMRGPNATPPYDYADMPHVMYFKGSFGIHGVYHHDSFGVRRSAGCVNLSPYDARWFFEWAGPWTAPGQRQSRPSESEPGTWVNVAY